MSRLTDSVDEAQETDRSLCGRSISLPFFAGAFAGLPGCFALQYLSALVDELFSQCCCGWHGQHVEGAFGQLGEGDGVGGAEFALPLGVAPCAPALGGDPVNAGHVGCGEEAFALQQLSVTLRSGAVGDDTVRALPSRLSRQNILPPIALSPTQKTRFAPHCIVSTTCGSLRRKARAVSASMLRQ